MRREDTPSFLSDFLLVRAAPLLESFRDWARAQQGIIDASCAVADHFSYKCREVREYDELRARFEEHGDGWQGCRFSHQTVISGRRVTVFGLTEVVVTPLGDLRYLELSEPKPMKAETYGFDHVEIFPRSLGRPRWAAYADLVAVLKARSPFFEKERPHHTTWDALIPAEDRPGRQDLIVRLTDGPLVEKIGLEMR